MSDQGYGGGYGDPQYPSDPQSGQYGSGYGQEHGGGYGTGPTHGAPTGGSNQRGIFLGLGAVALTGLVVFILAIAGVFSGDGTPADGPKQVVEKVLFASKKQNLDDVKAVVCEKDLTNPALSEIVGNDHATSYSIGTVTEQSAERAVVDVRVTTSTDTDSTKLTVVKESNKWKVCFSESGNGFSSSSASPTSTTADPPSPTSDSPTTAPPITSASGGFCGTQATASDTAKTFISFITLSSESLAGNCVYQGRISATQITALTGDVYSPTQNDGQSGPKFVYRSAQNESTITLTVERESDGKYYVTAASKS